MYPVNLDLAGRPVLVVGAGRVATHKVTGLLRAGARVTVVAPEAHTAIAESPSLRWHRREYRRGEAASYRLVVTATNDPAVNGQVFRDGEAANVAVNSADDPDRCSFTLPAVVRQGDLQLTISTGGHSPALATWLRRRFEHDLGPEYGELLEVLASNRAELRLLEGTSENQGWQTALDDGLLDLIRAGRRGEAQARLRTHLGLPTHERTEVTT